MHAQPPFVSDLTRLRAEWDRRAGEDPRLASCQRATRWTREEFEASGRDTLAAIEGLDGLPGHGARVLDLGCGAGRLFAGLRARFGGAIALDISPRMLAAAGELAGSGIRLVLGDGMTLQRLRREQFDLVLAIDLFEHLPDRRFAGYLLRQLALRLAPDGRVLLRSAGAALFGAPPAELLPGSGLEQLPCAAGRDGHWTQLHRA